MATRTAAKTTTTWEQRLAELAPRRFHFEGCPGERLEAYGQVRPRRIDANGVEERPAAHVTVLHCLQCGDTSVIDTPYGELRQQLEEASE